MAGEGSAFDGHFEVVDGVLCLFQAQVDDTSSVEIIGHWSCAASLIALSISTKASFPWLSLRASSQARLLYDVAIRLFVLGDAAALRGLCLMTFS